MRPVIDYEARGMHLFTALGLVGQVGQVFLLLDGAPLGLDLAWVFEACREIETWWIPMRPAGYMARLDNATIKARLLAWYHPVLELQPRLTQHVPEAYRQTWRYATVPVTTPGERGARLAWVGAHYLRAAYNDPTLLNDAQEEAVVAARCEAGTLGPKRLRRAICRVEFQRACGQPPPNKLILDAFEAVWMLDEDRARRLAREWLAEQG